MDLAMDLFTVLAKNKKGIKRTTVENPNPLLLLILKKFQNDPNVNIIEAQNSVCIEVNGTAVERLDTMLQIKLQLDKAVNIMHQH